MKFPSDWINTSTMNDWAVWTYDKKIILIETCPIKYKILFYILGLIVGSLITFYIMRKWKK